MQHALGACPSVERTAHASHALGRISQRQTGSTEHLLGLQDILRRLWINADVQVVLVLSSGIDAYLEVAAPAECGTDSTALMLLRFAVERQHHLRGIEMSVAGTITVANCLQTACQRFLCHVSLGSPVAMQMRQPYVATTQRQMAGIEAFQRNGLLLTIGNLRPRLDDVYRLIGLIAYLHCDGHQLILHSELMNDG